MFTKIFLSTAVTTLLTVSPAMANDPNQPQDHRSTINQQQHNQVGQPIDNRIDRQIRQNDSVAPVSPPSVRPLPDEPNSHNMMNPAPPPNRINSQTPQTYDPSTSIPRTPQSDIRTPSHDIPRTAPDTTYPDDALPDGNYPDSTNPDR